MVKINYLVILAIISHLVMAIWFIVKGEGVNALTAAVAVVIWLSILYLVFRK